MTTTRRAPAWPLIRAGAFALGAVIAAAPLIRDATPVLASVPLDRFLAFELFGALVVLGLLRGTLASAALSVCALVTGVWVTGYLGSDAALFRTPDAPFLVFGLLSIAVTLALSERAGGYALTLVVAGVVALGYVGQFVVPALIPATSFPGYLGYLSFGSGGLLGRPLDIIVNIVLAFVLFGWCFEAAGSSDAIAAVARRLAGESRARTIRVCVVASGLFGMTSGAATSNVLMSGRFSIPAMQRTGVPAPQAAGIEAAASTLGQVTPPVMGAAAFVLADLAGLSYAQVAAAGALPALLCYLAFYRIAAQVAPDGPPLEDDTPAPPLRAVMWLHALPPLVLIAALSRPGAGAGGAALLGIGASLAVGLILQGPAMTLRRLSAGMGRTLEVALNLICVAGAVGLLLGALHYTGLSVAAALLVGRLGEAALVLSLGLAALTALILGLGMATVGVYVVTATTLAPGLIDAGVAPVAAHFFCLYYGMLSMITPPVAFASFAASRLTGAPFGPTSLAAVRFGWVLFAMPMVFVAAPGLLLEGSVGQITRATSSAGVLIWCATAPRLGLAGRGATVALGAGALLVPDAWGLLLSGMAAGALWALHISKPGRSPAYRQINRDDRR